MLILKTQFSFLHSIFNDSVVPELRALKQYGLVEDWKLNINQWSPQ